MTDFRNKICYSIIETDYKIVEIFGNYKTNKIFRKLVRTSCFNEIGFKIMEEIINIEIKTYTRN